MATAHIDAKPSDFAKTVLMPGDPLRAKYLAENFLENPRLVNNVRSVQGYTGIYKGKEVSVMASGMGMPSIAIYSHELFNFFGVENIIRIGSAGAVCEDIKVGDIILGLGASNDSNFQDGFGLCGHIAPICSYKLLKTAVECAEQMNVKTHIGSLYSSDTFYLDTNSEEFLKNASKMGMLAVEMEAAALYLNAMRFKKNALAICTVSNNIVTGEELGAAERETGFNEMLSLSLETAIRL